MPEAGDTKVEDLVESIQSVPADHITEIPFGFFDKQSNRTTKLVASSGQTQPVDGRHRWFDYKFTEPVLISSIEIDTTGYNSFHEFESKLTNANGQESSFFKNLSDDKWLVVVNDICRRFSFRPPSVFFSSPSILQILVQGLEKGNISAALDNLSDIEGYKDNIIKIANDRVAAADRRILAAKSADAERANTLRELTQIKSNVSRNKKTVDDLAHKKNVLITENSAAEDSLKLSRSQLSKVDIDTKELQKQYAELTSGIAESKSELKALQENINLFPSEIVAFVNQGSKNIQQYAIVSSIPISIILIMLVLLVKGAADLTVVISNNPEVNI